MKVLLISDPDARSQPRGGEILVENIRVALIEQGFFPVDYGDEEIKFNEISAVFVFSLQMSKTLRISQFCSAGVKVFCWPMFWGARASLSANDVDQSIVYVFGSAFEESHFLDSCEADGINAIVLHHPVSRVFHRSYDEIFPQIIGTNRYGLCVGTIEERNNQLEVIDATSNLDIPIFFVGKEVDSEYASQCRNMAELNHKFFGDLPFAGRVLVSAYRNCSFYVELSVDPPGLSAVEAYSCGAKCILSNPIWCNEYIPSDTGRVFTSSDFVEISDELLDGLNCDNCSYASIEFEVFLSKLLSD